MSVGAFTASLQVGENAGQARIYNSRTGRFTQPDTIIPDRFGPQTRNRYSYVSNNPVNKIDPTGNCEFDAETGDISRFDCSPDEFDNISVAERKRWIYQFMKQSKYTDWFNNIAGIIEAFEASGNGEPGSWLSVVDAYILAAIQDGWALATEGIQSRNINNLGEKINAHLWEQFFKTNRGDVGLMITRWGLAEQAATQYGVQKASARGLSPSTAESIFLQSGNFYRDWLAGYDEREGSRPPLRDACANRSRPACQALADTLNSVDQIADPRSEYLGTGHHFVYWALRGISIIDIFFE